MSSDVRGTQRNEYGDGLKQNAYWFERCLIESHKIQEEDQGGIIGLYNNAVREDLGLRVQACEAGKEYGDYWLGLDTKLQQPMRSVPYPYESIFTGGNPPDNLVQIANGEEFVCAKTKIFVRGRTQTEVEAYNLNNMGTWKIRRFIDEMTKSDTIFTSDVGIPSLFKDKVAEIESVCQFQKRGDQNTREGTYYAQNVLIIKRPQDPEITNAFKYWCELSVPNNIQGNVVENNQYLGCVVYQGVQQTGDQQIGYTSL